MRTTERSLTWAAVVGLMVVSTIGGPSDAAAGATIPGSGAVKCDGLAVTITGTDGADVIDGTSGDDVIAGLGGEDLIHGHGGDDVICGGDDSDLLRGGTGNDRLFGPRTGQLDGTS